jgi:enamine deaminase RidA (YjgF/YER057c/UK114 family)
MSRQIIQTDKAPAAIGPYSQAVRAGDTVYLSGQIPLDPSTGLLVEGDIVRLGLYLTDLDNFAAVNAVMSEFFKAPYPARSTVEVAGLPRGARFEVDAVMVLD